MTSIKFVSILALTAAIGFANGAAWAQVPQHPPGSICFTPKFWCWATAGGAPGAPCTCSSPYGPVGGHLG